MCFVKPLVDVLLVMMMYSMCRPISLHHYHGNIEGTTVGCKRLMSLLVPKFHIHTEHILHSLLHLVYTYVVGYVLLDENVDVKMFLYHELLV